VLSHFVRKLRPQPSEPLRTVRSPGFVWYLRSGASELLGSAPDLAEWQKRGLATLVKRNFQRSIWRVTLPGGTIYVKQCRANSPRSWLRELVRPPKARLEFENALALLSSGVGCTEPLAWGAGVGRWPGDSFIITREAAGAVPLDRFLEAPLTPQRRREIAKAFGRFLGAMHRAEFLHPDPHPGNFLLAELDGGEQKFLLLDVHALKLTSTVAERIENLVILNRWFQMRATRSDRAHFWQAYGAANGDATGIEVATRKSNLRFWANRLGRYLGDNREFRKISGAGVCGHAVRDLPDEVLSKWIADPDAAFAAADAKLLKDSPSSTVALRTCGSQSYIFKRFRRGSVWTGLKNRLRRSSALRSWIAGQSLRDRGLPTARPLAILHRIRAGLPREGYLIFEFVAGAVGLPEAMAMATRERRRELLDQLGRLIRDLHDRGVSHRDLKAPNILVADGEPILIDLVGVRLGLRVPDRERVRNLARLNASSLVSPAITNADRLRLLRAYRSWIARPTGDWKAHWRAIAAETSAKVEKNRRSGRVLA